MKYLLILFGVAIAIVMQAVMFEYGAVTFYISLIVQFAVVVMFCVVIAVNDKKILPIFALVFSFVLFASNMYVFTLNNPKDYNYVLHVGGALDGHAYLNSKQSIEHYIAKDINLIELDFAFTKDQKIICTHYFEYMDGKSFSNKPTYQEVLDMKLLGKYDVITFDWLIETLEQNPDVKIVFDTKENDSKTLLSQMIEEANLVDFDILNRFIVQVYSIENYNEISELNFAEYWFTNYKANYLPHQVKKYFEDKDNLSTYVMTPTVWHTFMTLGFSTNKKLAIHTINIYEFEKFLTFRGVDYIYRDYL